MTLSVDCPWCDAPTTLRDDDANLRCEACGVTADLAPTEPARLADAA
jgi:primosomal protein N'